MTQEIAIGRMLRAGTSGFVVGCNVSQWDTPTFGGMVRIPLSDGYQIYGLIYDIRIDDDGLVRQLITAKGIDDSIISDNRENRNIPIEMSVLAIGYREKGSIRHLMPPRPALSLDVIYLCSNEEIRDFTSAGRFGYFRHILRGKDYPVGELLVSHLQFAQSAHREADNSEWMQAATGELITLLRDDYPTLMDVLSALGDAVDQ